MSGSKWLWVGGGVFSLLAHATAAAILTMAPAPEEEQSMIAGGVVAEVAMLGSAFNATESGDPQDEITPEVIQPDVAETVPQQLAEIQPTEIQPETTELVAPTDPVISQSVEELIVPSAEVEIAAIPIPEIKPEVEPEQEIKPVPEAKKEEPVKKLERTKPKQKPVKKAGEKGKNNQNSTKGEIDGVEDVKSTTAGAQKKGNSSTAGDAAVSNYPGKIRNKINRSKKRVSGGKGQVVLVSFVVSANGAASAIRIARSSGIPKLDDAAIESVKRASPFAKIPDTAGKSSWKFNVPVTFN